MKLYYDKGDKADKNKFIYPGVDPDHLEYHKIDENDLKRLDDFYKMLCEIIDDCDSIIIEYDDALLNKYKNNLKYDFYEHIDGAHFYSNNNIYVFSINDEKSKQYLKDNIDFDIYQYDDEHAELYPEIDRKYIQKDTDKFIGLVTFIKQNKVMYSFDRFLGRIVCCENFKNRKYKNIYKKSLSLNENTATKKNLFTYKEILDDNGKIKKYLIKYFNEIDLNVLLIEKYDGDLLKDRSSYGYYDLYINNKLINKCLFEVYMYNGIESYLDKISKTILNDIKSNKNNTYYFNRFKDVSEYLCLELMLNNGIIEEIRDNKSIKQFTKKNRSYSK